MYGIADYGAMIADEVRMDAFARALQHIVRPGSVVVDLGTGTGIFALLACRLGARRVFAIEPDDAIAVAAEIAAANGYAGRIEFLQEVSTRVTLPERADVIISDIGGVLPWFGQHIPSIVDARRRFLAPAGSLIPARDVAWTAVVEAPELYAPLVGPWEDNAFHLDMEAARRLVVNTWMTARITASHLLTAPQRWGALDYQTVDDPDVRANVSCTVTRAGTGHGLATGFERTVADGILLSTAPDAPEAIRPPRIYGTALFPWPRPVSLSVGDVVTVEIAAALRGGDYVWSWNTSVLDAGRPDAVKARFRQSTFHGTPLSPARLRQRAHSYVPTLNEDGRIARLALDAMDGRASLRDIAERLAAAFPARFARPIDALTYLGGLSLQYGTGL